MSVLGGHFSSSVPTVSIHVLRRGRCVDFTLCVELDRLLVSIHVLRRGRCVRVFKNLLSTRKGFQSTSSEEDVVSIFHALYSVHIYLFQSTSSEEDVVSATVHRHPLDQECFNPRPPKRTLCPTQPAKWSGLFDSFNPRPPKRTLCPLLSVTTNLVRCVSIHVLRRGRCVSV